MEPHVRARETHSQCALLGVLSLAGRVLPRHQSSLLLLCLGDIARDRRRALATDGFLQHTR